MNNTCVILPVHNTEHNLKELIKRIRVITDNAVSVSVFNDNTEDKGMEVIENSKPDYLLSKRTDLVSYGRAILESLKYLSNLDFEYAITMDTDGEHDPGYIQHLIKLMPRCHMVIGSRFADWYGMQRSQMVNKFVTEHHVTDRINNQYKTNFTDTLSGFRAFKIQDVLDLKIKEPNFAFSVQTLLPMLEDNAYIVETTIPFNYIPNEFGSEMNPLYLDQINNTLKEFRIK